MKVLVYINFFDIDVVTFTVSTNEPVKSDEISERFAEFFEKKVGDIVSKTVVNPRVYNGHQKIHAESSMFMSRGPILDCIDGRN